MAPHRLHHFLGCQQELVLISRLFLSNGHQYSNESYSGVGTIMHFYTSSTKNSGDESILFKISMIPADFKFLYVLLQAKSIYGGCGLESRQVCINLPHVYDLVVSSPSMSLPRWHSIKVSQYPLRQLLLHPRTLLCLFLSRH